MKKQQRRRGLTTQEDGRFSQCTLGAQKGGPIATELRGMLCSKRYRPEVGAVDRMRRQQHGTADKAGVLFQTEWRSGTHGKSDDQQSQGQGDPWICREGVRLVLHEHRRDQRNT